MDFSHMNKLSSFTNMVTNVKNHENHKFGLKWPECLVPLILQLICINNQKLKTHPDSSKMPKLVNFSNLTCCLYGALGWTKAHGPCMRLL